MAKDKVIHNEWLDEVSIQNMMSKCQASTKGLFAQPSLMDSITETIETYDELVDVETNNGKIRICDHYGNSLTATGTDDKVQSFTNYGFSNDTLNWTLWLALYNDSWVFRRAIDKPSQDEIACGITIHGNEDYSKIYKAYSKHAPELIDIIRWGALFGGSVGVMMFDGLKDEDYAKPMKLSQIKGRKMRIYVTDRWYGIAQSNRMVSSMRDIDFGKPTHYDITFGNGKSHRVHHSFVLRYEHRTAPRLIKSGQLQHWGYAEGAHIINELSRDDQLKSSITSLVNKSLIEIIKMAGMRGVFMGTDKGNMRQLEKRLEMVNWGRNYNSLTFLDKDDEYAQYQMTSLSGLAELLEKNMWLISAALEMQGILYGDLKGGLSQETDAFHRYALTIHNRDESWVRPIITKFLKVLFAIYDVKGSPDFDFNFLDKADQNKAKIEGIKTLSDMFQSLVTNGIISKYQYAVGIKDFINNEAINLIITDEHLNKLKLEEEQVIIDAYKEATKKRKLNMEIPTFGRENLTTPSENSPSVNSEVETTTQSPTETETQQEESSTGESANGTSGEEERTE